MADKQENNNVYIIPPNFIETGTFFGGLLKIRNAIEAGILAIIVGMPVFQMQINLTTKIIILCLTSLPVALFALIGVAGESLSSFLIIFIRYLRNRRVVGATNSSRKASPAGVKKNRNGGEMYR